MPDEGPLEHYLTVSHEPEPDISEPAPERSPGPWRERGIMLGLGFLLGCIGAYALVYSEMSGGMRSLKQSLSEERDLNASLQKERAHLRETLEQARMDALLEERSPPFRDGRRCPQDKPQARSPASVAYAIILRRAGIPVFRAGSRFFG